MPADESTVWTVWRTDDAGNSFVVRENLSAEEAARVVDEFTARGHKQLYWAEPEPTAAEREAAQGEYARSGGLTTADAVAFVCGAEGARRNLSAG